MIVKGGHDLSNKMQGQQVSTFHIPYQYQLFYLIRKVEMFYNY